MSKVVKCCSLTPWLTFTTDFRIMETTTNIHYQMIVTIFQMIFLLTYLKINYTDRIQKFRKIAGRLLNKISWVSLVFQFNWIIFQNKKMKKEFEWNRMFNIKDFQIKWLEPWKIINSNFWKWGFKKEVRLLIQVIVKWILLV